MRVQTCGFGAQVPAWSAAPHWACGAVLQKSPGLRQAIPAMPPHIWPVSAVGREVLGGGLGGSASAPLCWHAPSKAAAAAITIRLRSNPISLNCGPAHGRSRSNA